MFNKSNNTMTGTGGGPYKVVAVTPQGAIGYSDLGDGTVRVRVELQGGTKSLNLSGEWRPPNSSQNRYSTVVSVDAVGAAVVEARKALQAAAPSVADNIAKALAGAGF